MDLILILSWLITALAVLCGIIGSLYRIYIRDAGLSQIIAKLVLALMSYCLITIPALIYSGFILSLGTHSDPKGSVLNTNGLLIGFGLILVYLLIGWLICSFIVGHWIFTATRASRSEG